MRSFALLHRVGAAGSVGKQRRTRSLLKAGRQLISTRDYARISIAEIARVAGCSVGAFYDRFHSKQAFIQRLIDQSYGEAISEIGNDEASRGGEATSSAHEIVRGIIKSVAGDDSAGVTRAALKRVHFDETSFASPLAYRKAVMDLAVKRLLPLVGSVPHPETAIRRAIQMVFATAHDALIHNDGPLHVGTSEMENALTAAMIRLLDLKSDREKAPSTKAKADAPSGQNHRRKTFF